MVEKKVQWSAIGSYLGGLAVLAVLQGVSSQADLIRGLPDVVEVLVTPLIPALITFVSGYVAKHTPRPDLIAKGGEYDTGIVS